LSLCVGGAFPALHRTLVSFFVPGSRASCDHRFLPIPRSFSPTFTTTSSACSYGKAAWGAWSPPPRSLARPGRGIASPPFFFGGQYLRPCFICPLCPWDLLPFSHPESETVHAGRFGFAFFFLRERPYVSLFVNKGDPPTTFLTRTFVHPGGSKIGLFPLRIFFFPEIFSCHPSWGP